MVQTCTKHIVCDCEQRRLKDEITKLRNLLRFATGLLESTEPVDPLVAALRAEIDGWKSLD